MSTGFGGGGAAYHLEQLEQYPAGEIQSEVLLILPYGLPGLAGDYVVQTPRGMWRVFAQTRYIPPKAIEPHLEGYVLTVDEDGWVSKVKSRTGVHVAPKRKMVSLDPDRWGRSWRTELHMTFSGVLHPGDVNQIPGGMALRVLEPCCVCINRMLDALAYVGGASDLQLLRPDDFWSVKVDYTYNGVRIGYFHSSGLQTFWWRGPRPLEAESQDALRSLLQSERFLSLEDELIVTALRKLGQGDFRGAIIDAICAVESVLGPFLEAELQFRGISKSKAAGVLGPSGLGLADQIHVLLPLLQQANEQIIPENLRSDFAEANGKRNRIVHRGEGANRREAEKHLATCRKVVEQLSAWRKTQDEQRQIAMDATQD
jgi:hypothetical protein